jgi:small ligand-binding sensory domain FIST
VSKGSAGTRIGSGLSTTDDTEAAFREAASQARQRIGVAQVDLAVVFLSGSHLERCEAGMQALDELLSPLHMIGCCAQGVVGTSREVEEGPGVSVWAASLPGARVESFHLAARPGGDEGIEIDDLPALERPDLMLLLTDPVTFPADLLLERAAVEHPGLPAVGGIASGAHTVEDSVLFMGSEQLDGGAVGSLVGGVDVLPCVSQGAAPIGPEMVVTAAEANLVLELASKPALEKVGEVLAEVGPHERALASTGLLMGIVIDENRPEYGRGDFLIRGLLGADRSTGALAIGDVPRVGQTVRLHVRDARSADEDLREALARQTEALGGRPPVGALLFTCNGRGRHMFPVEDHDAAALADSLGEVPVSGFFCAGEIGPVGGRNFLHGFTATMALFS